MPFNLGWPEIVLILVIVLIIFGAGKLPQIGNAVGKSIKEFRKASRGEDKEDQEKTKASVESNQSETKEKS